MSLKNAPGTALAFIEVAKRNVGFIEGPRNNENPYAPKVGDANFAAWCASFVRACAVVAGVVLPKGHSAYTPTFAQAFKDAGLWGHTPRPGAVVFFEWPSMGRICHVGIVESVNRDGSINTCEGNTNAHGSRTGGMVCELTRRGSTIAGYGYPDFEDDAPAKPAAKKAAPAKPDKRKPNPHPTPLLTKDRPALRASAKMTAAEIKWVQWAVGVPQTGRWDAATTQGVRRVQGVLKIEVDGVVGPQTLTKFRGVIR